jgi:hypothetical protein
MATSATRVPGQIIGRPGGSLTGATWAKNDAVARIGKAGEVRTAAVLDALALRPGGPTVMHDLRIPIPGINANIDHLLISGRTVFIVDAKVWKPGTYWTLNGRTRRGLSRFTPAEKKTMPMAVKAITGYLTSRDLAVRLATPLVVVWPSSERAAMHLWAMSSPGARVVSGRHFAARAHRLLDTKPADAALVIALTSLVIGATRMRDTLPAASGF